MPKRIPDEVKQEALRLRVEGRLSIDEIKRQTGLSVGTISALLKDYPLSEHEVNERISHAAIRTNSVRKYSPDQSKFAAALEGEHLSTERKGQIAEAAVLFRLALQGYEVWKANFEGNRVDWLVSRPRVNKHVRLQVKWAKRDTAGRPLVQVCNGEHGKLRRMTPSHCDFVVGYDLETDTAYVIPVRICEGKRFKACDAKYAEAWQLLGI
jgi:transposase-like protein